MSLWLGTLSLDYATVGRRLLPICSFEQRLDFIGFHFALEALYGRPIPAPYR